RTFHETSRSIVPRPIGNAIPDLDAISDRVRTGRDVHCVRRESSATCGGFAEAVRSQWRRPAGRGGAGRGEGEDVAGPVRTPEDAHLRRAVRSGTGTEAGIEGVRPGWRWDVGRGGAERVAEAC